MHKCRKWDPNSHLPGLGQSHRSTGVRLATLKQEWAARSGRGGVLGSIRPGTRRWAPQAIAPFRAGAREGKAGSSRSARLRLPARHGAPQRRLASLGGLPGTGTSAAPNRGSRPASGPTPEDLAGITPGLRTQGPRQWDDPNTSAPRPRAGGRA